MENPFIVWYLYREKRVYPEKFINDAIDNFEKKNDCNKKELNLKNVLKVPYVRNQVQCIIANLAMLGKLF